jgi:hypothetical protein
VIPAVAFLALARPFPDSLPLFPIWPGEAWTLSLGIWSALAVVSAALLAVATSEVFSGGRTG